MSAPIRAAQPEITRHRASAEAARDRFEARNRIDGGRAGIADGIKAVWRAHLAGEFDWDEAAKREQSLRDQLPPPYDPAPRASPPTPRRAVRRPDLIDRRRHVRKLAFSGPMPPKLAAAFTPSQLAVLNIIGDEVVKKGTCRISVKELADRAKTCHRTVQNAVREARLRALLVVKRRRLTRTMSLPNIVIITSKEWLTWLARRGAWEPSPRTAGDLSAVNDRSNMGAKRCAPQVINIRKKEDWRERQHADDGRGSQFATRWREALAQLSARVAADQDRSHEEEHQDDDDQRFRRAKVINPEPTRLP